MIKNTDTLLLFFIISICTLYGFVGDINYFIGDQSQYQFKTYINSEDVYAVPTNGIINKPLFVKNYNANFELFSSTNGGKSFIKIDESTNLLNSRFENLNRYQMSIRQKPKIDEVLAKDMPVIKSFLIKAKHKYKSIHSQPKCLTYIKNYHSNLPIINIVCHQDDLVDDFNGMMVFGKHSWIDDGFYKEFWYRNANYKQEGSAWRKKAYIQLFENEALVYETITGIEISGHATRSFPQKSLKLKTDKRYNPEKLNYPFFKSKGFEKYHSLVLRISGNDNTKTLFADLLMHHLVENTNVITLKGQPVNMFLNGNYWGIYNIREKPDTYFLAQKENCKSKDITILENSQGILKKGSEKQHKKYVEFVDSLVNLQSIDAKTLKRIKEVIDVNSFTDYIIIETFYGNDDWLHNNTLWYKAKHKKWKWILIDLDYGLMYTGEKNLTKNYFNKLKLSNSITAQLFNSLISNNSYKLEFKKRAKQIVQSIFNKKNVVKKFNTLKQKYNSNIKYHVKRWTHTFTYNQWLKNCNANLDFLINRPHYYLIQVNNL